jgi:hypothetical protein
MDLFKIILFFLVNRVTINCIPKIKQFEIFTDLFEIFELALNFSKYVF